MGKKIAIIFLAFTLSGCAEVTESPPPVEHYAVVTSPELEPIVVPWLIGFQKTEPNAILHLETLAPVTLADPTAIDDVDLIITAHAPPEGWFATPLVRESLVVIVPPTNPIESLAGEAIEDIFTGRIRSWAELGGDELAIEPIIPLEGEASRQIFQSVVLTGGRFTLNALLAPDQDYMREMVADRPGGIGFLLSSLVTSEVREMVISESTTVPDSEAVPETGLAIELLAIGSEEPSGGLREFLVWLQGSVLQ